MASFLNEKHFKTLRWCIVVLDLQIFIKIHLKAQKIWGFDFQLLTQLQMQQHDPQVNLLKGPLFYIRIYSETNNTMKGVDH